MHARSREIKPIVHLMKIKKLIEKNQPNHLPNYVKAVTSSRYHQPAHQISFSKTCQLFRGCDDCDCGDDGYDGGHCHTIRDQYNFWIYRSKKDYNEQVSKRECI